jgi:DNA polymerase III subunit gamma/tau
MPRGRCAPRTCAQMLGLADRTRVIDLFEALMKGDVAAARFASCATSTIRRRSGRGAGRPRRVHPFRHPREGRPASPTTGAVRGRARARARLGAALSMRVLSRTWQMLLKGIAEVQQARRRPLAAAEMVLVRIAYAADLPTPDEAIRRAARRARRCFGRAAARGRAVASEPTPRRRAAPGERRHRDRQFRGTGGARR